MYLFVKALTSGHIKKALPLDATDQPWVVHISAQLADADGTEIASINTGIRASGRTVGSDAAAYHGVSTRRASVSGTSEKAALSVLCGKESLASQARYIIGHGLCRDTIKSVILRNKWDSSVWERHGVCFVDTMTAATPFCKLKGEHDSGSYRWPSLDEACEALLGEPPRAGHHDAWDDLRRAKALFFWLRERGAFDLEVAA
jgi:hypothetical protein